MYVTSNLPPPPPPSPPSSSTPPLPPRPPLSPPLSGRESPLPLVWLPERQRQDGRLPVDRQRQLRPGLACTAGRRRCHHPDIAPPRYVWIQRESPPASHLRRHSSHPADAGAERDTESLPGFYWQVGGESEAIHARSGLAADAL